MKISASKLRNDIYNILDKVLEEGITVQILRKGRVIKIVPDKKPKKLARLKKRECLNTAPESLVHLDWSGEWRKEQFER